MSGSTTRGRWFSLLTAVLTALLVVTFVAPGSATAHPGRGGKHTDAPNVNNTFNGSFFGGVFPASITCEWIHRQGGQPVNAYVCTDDSRQAQQEQRLSNQSDVQGGLLQPGDFNAPDYQVANPEEFRCDRVGSANTPSDYACRYRIEHHGGIGNHDHFFRMDEMVMMEDPDVLPDPHGRTQIFYVWPPHK